MIVNVSYYVRMTLAGLLTLVLVSPAMAGLYKCVDRQNRTYYQDSPCPEMTTASLPSSLKELSGMEDMWAFFWKATDGKGTLYLLGSLHFGLKSLFPLPEMVNEAFNRSDVLVVEADINNLSNKEVADSLLGKGRYADNSRLEDHIKRVTWNKTLELANRLELNEDLLLNAKPWLAALILRAQSLSREGYTAELGIEKSLIQQAQGKKPVLELENVEDQIKLLDQFSDQEQEQILIHSVQDLSRGHDFHKNILNAWKKGDAEAMDMIVRQSFDKGQIGAKLFKAFYLERNERMANRLKEFAGDGRAYFIVVGSGHLGGEHGILKLLEERGFTIIQP